MLWQDDLPFFRIVLLSIKDSDMTDLAAKFGGCLFSDFNAHRLNRIPVIIKKSDLDQFMIVQGGIDLFKYGRRETVLPDHHNRIKMMRLAAQIFAVKSF